MKNQLIILFFATLLSFNISAQSKKLSIKVKDENNKPLAGAIILFDNVRQKRWTNSNGVFKTKIETSPKEISAFHPSIGISTIKYNEEKKCLIIVKKGKDAHVFSNSKQKINSSRFNNIYDYLRGKVPGVNVSSDNIINIRGYNTLNGDMTPLFILDGVAISKEMFGFIMPDEIKSVTVLKGPDSAVYGVRAANGVIIVNTNQN